MKCHSIPEKFVALRISKLENSNVQILEAIYTLAAA
jgi:hypothetical protein